MFKNTFKKRQGTQDMELVCQELRHELLCLWDFIGQENLWAEAREYMEGAADDPLPFGFWL